jgi:hypothetical protein
MKTRRSASVGTVTRFGVLFVGLILLAQSARSAMWLQMTNLNVGYAGFILHGTEAGTNYTIESRENLSSGAWAAETVIIGATNQDWTSAGVAIGDRTNRLFLRARLGADPIVSNLWIEIPTNALAVPGQLTLVIHNTIQDRPYDVLTNSDLAEPAALWKAQQSVPGAVGDSTTVLLPLNGQALLVRARFGGDSDGDGLPGWWEMAQGLDPNNADTGNTGISDGARDPDADGYVNLEEYLLDQDPQVADPPPPTVTLTATDANAGEPSNPGAFTFTRTGAATKSLVVHFTTRGLARAVRDFSALGGSVTFNAGQTNVALQILPIDDSEYEGSEDVTLQLLPALEYVIAGTDTASVTLTDDEVQPVKVSASIDPVVEGSGTNGVFRFYREGDARLPLTLNFTLTGTATNGVIYQTLPTTITFAADADAATLAVIPINNTTYSGGTTSILTLLPNAAYRIETNAGSAELTFVDDDLPVVNLEATDADAREAGLNSGRCAVSRTGATQEALTVYYRVSGSASMGYSNNYTGDYQSLSNVAIIPAGQSSVFVDIIPVQDTVAEPFEQVILTLAGSEHYRIGASNAAAVNLDDDEALSYQATVERPSAYDPSVGRTMPGIIRITRNGSALAPASVPWSVTFTNGTPASQNVHYQISGDFLNGNLYFAPTQSTARVLLQHISTTVSNLQFRWAGQIATVPCWAADRLVRIAVTRDYAIEGQPGNKAAFYVYRAANGGSPLTIRLRLSGIATPDVDFNATNVQTVTIAQGSSSQLVEVYANPDAATEGWESLVVRLDTADLTYTTYNPNVSQTDLEHQETHGVLWLREAGTTGPRPDVDSDGDMLTDAFETAHGLNILVPNEFQTDTDKDGLSILEEQLAGTDPDLPDTDGDGVNDFFEVSRGSSPTNAADFALTSDHTVEVKCLVGDDNGVASELWQLRTGCFVVNNGAPGQLIGRTICLKEGFSYPVTLCHLGSVTNPPDLDYHIELRSGDSAPPSFLVNDPQQLLGSHTDPGDGPQYSNKTATVIVPRLELAWTNKGDNLPLDTNTNGFNGEVRGQRIFTGAKTPSDSNLRNTVMLRIKSTPPLVGSNVWLRAFDVDDTTDDQGLDNAGVIDSNRRSGGDNLSDHLGTPGSGLFVSSGQSSNVVTLNASGEALLEFRVGMQPGNNYRVAATVFPTNNLGNLQSSNAVGSGYVSACTDKVRTGFNGTLSPLLTVWRKLSLEFDSMSAVPASGPEANVVPGQIVGVRTNLPAPGQSRVVLQFSPSVIENHRLENGTLDISGVGAYTILANELYRLSPCGGQTVVTVSGTIPAAAAGAICTLQDDDERWVVSAALPRLPMDGYSQQFINGFTPSLGSKRVAGLAETFAPAFISVVDANQSGWNPRRTVPCYLNRDVFDDPLTFAGVFDDAKDLTDDPLFWAHTVTFGFQPLPAEDGDPNTDDFVVGVTPEAPGTDTAFGYSVVYKESIADFAIEYRAGASGDLARHQSACYEWLLGVCAHEIGHAPGAHSIAADHAEGRLMGEGGGQILGPESFKPVTLRRFRTATSWTGGAP